MDDQNLSAEIFDDVLDYEDDCGTEAETNIEAFYIALKMALARLEAYATTTAE